MTNFKADFTYYPTDIALLNAPARIEFTNTSIIAYANDADQFTYAVDQSNKVYVPTLPLSTYLIFNIDKTIWNFGDETYSNDVNTIKSYDFAGIYTVKLTVYSNEIYDEITGVTFRILNVKTIDIELQSTILTWLKMHMTQPHSEAMENSQAFNDLISAPSKMYDRMYKDIHDVANLMDIKKVAPKFLEYFSDTLNHKRFYSKKIGYSVQDNNEKKEAFLDYDIFERISKGIAGNAELELFRQFIIDTASLFKQNGSKKGMEDFFKLYSFIIHINELWTTNFEQTSDSNIVDNFFLDSTLENTKNKFKFKGLNISGWQNDKVKISGTFNNLLIDNYHFISKHSYPGDVIDSDGCSQKFEINDYNPNVKDVFRDDGRSIIDTMSCNGVEILTPCSSSTSASSGTNSDIKIEKNDTWIGANTLLYGNVGYKFWNTPTGYVKSIIVSLGILPSNLNEIDEIGDFGDTTDDYIWGDWRTGVTVPDGIAGVNKDSLNKPSLVTTLPFINYSTTDVNSNLIQLENFPIPTTNDLFVVARGFISIPKDAYYVFGVESGNSDTSSDVSSQQVMLFSLKHSTTYSINDIIKLGSLDNISFLRDSTDVVTTIGPTSNPNSFNVYSKKGEYGIIELRQNQIFENSGHYYLKEGYYAFEMKATYSSLNSKKLKLYWEAYVPYILDTTINFENIISKKPIPSINFLSINDKTSGIENNQGKGYLSIPNQYIEGGDLIGVLYNRSNSSPGILSGIISNKSQYKDCEINIRFTPNSISEFEANSNSILPQKTLLAVFRATYKNLDLYSNIDSYYAVSIDGFRGKISLMKIEYSKEIQSEVVFKLNLNPDLTLQDKQIFNKTILDENGYVVEFDDNIYYDIKITVKNDTVSVSYRKNTNFSNLTSNLFVESKNNIINYEDSIQYTDLITNITLNQSSKDIFTCDLNDNNLNVSDIYTMNSDAGYYGLAVKSSNIKVSSFEIIPFDKTDENLSTNEEKYKNIKTKYLDSRQNKNLNFISSNDNTSVPSYSVEVATTYSTSANSIQTNLQNITDNVINNLNANNVDMTSWGTRFNIVFNRDYLNNRFQNVNQVLDSVIIPFGHFYEPYVNWSQIDPNEYGYITTVQGGYNPFINENAKVLPHTVAISGSSKIYVSEMDRNSTTSTLLTVKNPLASMLSSTTHSVYNGVWEEVCPSSSSATWQIITANSKYNINNEVFEVVYRNKNTKTEIIGVKVLTSKVIEDLICEYCKDTIIWGLYEITLPSYTIASYQSYDNILKVNHINPIRYFIPIGKLNKEQDIYLPSPEILRNSQAIINLKGIYVNLDTTKVEIVDKINISLNKINRWENKYKSKIRCNYYIDIDTSFISKLTTYDTNPIDIEIIPNTCDNIQEPHNLISNDSCNSIPNAFYMPTTITNIIKYVQTNSVDFENDFNWWAPSVPWLKRAFNITYPNNGDNTVYSGLNTPNKFFSKNTNITNEQGVYLSLIDNFAADPGKYILDASWCVTSVGWDSNFAIQSSNVDGVGIFKTNDYQNMGFASTSKSKLGYEKTISIGSNLSCPLSLQTITVSGNTQLHFGDYLSIEQHDSKFISPYGLYNWFLGHANPINDTVSANPKTSWSLTEFNNQFINCFKFNNIYGQINTAYYKMNNYWSFYKESIPEKNSVIKIKETFDNNVTSTSTTIGVSTGINAFYAIPAKYIYYPNWVSHVENVFCDNYKIPTDLYYTRVNADTGMVELVFNTQNSSFDFSKLVGNTKLVLNVYSDQTNIPNLEKNSLDDDFHNNREINWISFLNNSNIYKVATRVVDTELKYTGNVYPYSIIQYKGNYCYKLVNKFEYSNNSFSGTNSTNNVGVDNNVGVTNNNGSINIINLIDKPSNNFSISCDVIFDPIMFNQNYDKKFELILKAKSDYSNGDFGIDDFYFVGIGSYNFDIALGMRNIDKSTGKLNETYLASYGNFNTKGIKVDVWYTLRAEISNSYINIYLNEKNSPEKLVLHYNIDKKYEKLTERYLKGEFETLQSIIIGLQELSITYPNTLNTTVSENYTFNNFKEEFAKTLPINGYLSGFKVYNPYTYVSNVKFDYFEPKKYKYGFAMDGSSYDDIIQNIKSNYSLPENPDVKKIQQALNYTIYILINDTLYYQQANHAPEIYKNAVDNFYIIQDKIFIIEKLKPLDAGLGLNKFIVGNNEIIWSLISNTYNITKLTEFFKYIPNLTKLQLNRINQDPIIINITDMEKNVMDMSIDELMNMNVSQLKYLPIIQDVNVDNYSLDQLYLLIIERLINTEIIQDSDLQIDDTIIFTIGGNRPITFPLEGVLGRYDIILRIYQEGFTQEYPILIKDKTFYNDELRTYMNYSNKKINKIVINDNRLNLIFKDI